jgi:two-component system LytT family response regulator
MTAAHLFRPLRRYPLPFSEAALLRSVERHGARWTFFDARDVPRIRAQQKHACFSMPNEPRRQWWLNESLVALGERLGPLGFVRIHRAELINLRFLRAVVRGRPRASTLTVELADGQRVRVSRRLASELRRTLTALMVLPPAA